MTVAEPAMDTSRVLASARASVRRSRRVCVALGAVLLALGVLGAVLVGAAARGDERVLLVAIFAAIAIVPGAALVAHGLSSVERHRLVVALAREPRRIRTVRKAWRPNVEGDHVEVVQVILDDGRRYTFPAST